MKLSIALVTCLLILSFSIAKAQTTPAATAMAARMKAAEEMLIASKGGEQYQKNMDTTMAQMAARVPEEKRSRFMAVMKTFAAKYFGWEAMKGDIALFYAHEFTEAELKQLTVFYKSPVWQKLYQMQPLILQATLSLTQKAVAEHQTELDQLIAEAMK